MSSKTAAGAAKRPTGGIIRAKGLTGIVTYGGGTVKITRHGLSQFNSGRGQAEVELPVESIVCLDWKTPTFWTNGFIWFMVAGDTIKPWPSLMRMTAASGKDNAVVFKKSSLAAFRQVRDAVQAAIFE